QDIDVMADLREVFQLIDADGSGKLSVDEFTQVISCLDTLLGDDAVAALIRSAGRDGDGEIDFDALIRTQVSTSALRVSVVAMPSTSTSCIGCWATRATWCRTPCGRATSRSFSAATTRRRRERSPASRRRSLIAAWASSGSTPTRTFTHPTRRRRATCTGCRW